MLAVMWGPIDEDNHFPGFGDGEQREVSVRGSRGVAEELTVFQQAVLPELGTALSWHEGTLSVTVVGRFWSMDRTDELVEVAEMLEHRDGAFRWPNGPAPGYEEVFSGSTASLGLILSPDLDYEVTYQGRGDDFPSRLIVVGARRPPHDLGVLQLFTRPLRSERIAGRDVLVGNAWTDDGPAVAAWQHADNLIVRVVGLGVDLESVKSVVEQSRELTAEEWADMRDASPNCPQPGPSPPEPDDETDVTV
jgi:hypothetical protein